MTGNTPATEELPIDWVRAQFPTLAESGVLFDNAGGTAPLGRVVDLVAEYMRRWPVQLGATYRESAAAAEKLSAARNAIAELLGSGSGTPAADEIVIGPSASSLLSRLARSLGPSLGRGDDIIVTNVDHEANITPWLRLGRSRGVNVVTWRLNRDSGRLELNDLLALLSERTRLVCFTHASNVLGEELPVASIVDHVHEHGARAVVDGVAYAPHRSLDMQAWGADFYVFSLYKVYGPHCAILYVRGAQMETLHNINHEFMEGSSGPGKLEIGAFPYELLYGSRGVVSYLRELSRRVSAKADPGDASGAFHAIESHEHRLTSRLIDFLASEPKVRIIGSDRAGHGRLPTISFVVKNSRSSDIPTLVDRQGIGIRWGHFYAPRLIEALGLGDQDGVVRVSMVHYNTIGEVDRLIGALGPLISGNAS